MRRFAPGTAGRGSTTGFSLLLIWNIRETCLVPPHRDRSAGRTATPLLPEGEGSRGWAVPVGTRYSASVASLVEASSCGSLMASASGTTRLHICTRPRMSPARLPGAWQSGRGHREEGVVITWGVFHRESNQPSLFWLLHPSSPEIALMSSEMNSNILSTSHFTGRARAES